MDLLRRPEINYQELTQLAELGPAVENTAVAEQVEVQAKYSGYIERQLKEIKRQQHNELTKIPKDIDYKAMKSLSNEVRQKFIDIKPETIGQASRIPGVTPAAISLLLVYLKKSAD